MGIRKSFPHTSRRKRAGMGWRGGKERDGNGRKLPRYHDGTSTRIETMWACERCP